ncbi:hypothetical protein ACFOW6_16190 [Fodinicurvata halophila]|uniref:Uncharacterized protein n=1 Tax=Fodinicurvata halophila TaxID=1419723 RepID=A0ABV8UPG1_9PROT
MTVLRTFDPILLMRLTTLENSHWSHTPKDAGPPDQEAKTCETTAPRSENADRAIQQE